VFCFGVFGVIEICIEKTGILPAKIVPSGWAGWVGQKDTFPPKTPKTPKNFSKCLSFNDLLFWCSLWGGFGVALVWLWCKCQILDFQRFANITQTLDFQRFYASLGAGWVGQG